MVTLNAMKCYEQEMIAVRRDLHQHPEIGFELYRTSEMVRSKLEEFGAFQIADVAQTGLIAVYDSGKPGRTVAIRADMDALPMDDELETAYRSLIPGAAHKCGHDAHTAMLLGIAHYIVDHPDEWNGVIKLVFQPSEERNPSSGAVEVLRSGLLDDVDVIFGQHVEPMYPAGTVAVRYGGLYAGATAFDLTIQGVGGHGATPHLTRDPIMTAALIISDAQMIQTRKTDPTETAVITFGSVHGGSAENVIPDKVRLTGTTRAMNGIVLSENRDRFDTVIRHLCEMNECDYSLSHEVVMPVLMTSREPTEMLEKQAVRLLGHDAVIIRDYADASGEDFAYYSEKIPCSFLMLGCSNEACHEGLHHPRFDLDERVLPIGASILLAAAQEACVLP